MNGAGLSTTRSSGRASASILELGLPPPVATVPSFPPWMQPRGKWMVSLVNSHTNATSIGWHLWEIDLRSAPGLPPRWGSSSPGRTLEIVQQSGHASLRITSKPQPYFTPYTPYPKSLRRCRRSAARACKADRPDNRSSQTLAEDHTGVCWRCWPLAFVGSQP